MSDQTNTTPTLAKRYYIDAIYYEINGHDKTKRSGHRDRLIAKMVEAQKLAHAALRQARP